ncbi:MAG: hypothetical protein NC900_05300 [Candidatus Omnitrophica bacterium]|nr:hypothetical protein [Candidatus Omnitrophota bacterium]
MEKVIYAIQVSTLIGSGLEILGVKIGQSKDIYSTLRQYKRSNTEVKILNLWEVNPSLNPVECEKGVQKIAEKYAYKRDGEKFIFLQNTYQDFVENVNLLLRSKEKVKLKREVRRKDEYAGEKPSSIVFLEKEYKVNSWRDVLCKIAEEIYKHKSDFSPAFEIRGSKRIYFTMDKKELVDPLKVGNTSVFCEGNLSANQIMRIIKKLLEKFDYNQNDLEVRF